MKPPGLHPYVILTLTIAGIYAALMGATCAAVSRMIAHD